MSDHGESLGELGIFLHGLPYAFAPEAQKRVPFIAWLGAELAARRGLDTACLRAPLDLPLSHDNLYHSVARPARRDDADLPARARRVRALPQGAGVLSGAPACRAARQETM